MLQLIFGDDEHTASEGPYSRVMKTRKWLYIVALALIAIRSGLYDEKAASEALKFIHVPTAVLKPAFTLGSIYLLLQYALLVGQLITTYDITLTERFSFRRAEELQAAQDRVRAAFKARDELRDKLYRSSAELRDESHYQFDQSDRMIEEAERSLEALHNQQPANRYGYRAIEVLIDIFRILPPAVLAIYAFFHSA